MSRDFPALVDLWQLVRSRREFGGTWPIARMERLVDALESDRGEVSFQVSFGTDETGTAYADLSVDAVLVLLCQRRLEPFDYPVHRQVRLGLIASEDEEVSLPAGYEPYVVPEEPAKLTDLVEDELILALPLVALSSSEPLEAAFGPVNGLGEEHGSGEGATAEHPFAGLDQALARAARNSGDEGESN